MQQNATVVTADFITRITSLQPWNYNECISTDKPQHVDINCTYTPSAISDSHAEPIELHFAYCISQQMVSSHTRHDESPSFDELSTLQSGELHDVLAPSRSYLGVYKRP